MELKVSPVYDNGASFYSKTSDERIENILSSDFKIKQVIYDSAVCSFVKDGKIVNPLKFIESMTNDECNRALIRIFPKINLNKIKELFDNIPYCYNDLTILSNVQRKLYYESIKYKYEKVFLPIYETLMKK